MPLDAMAVGVVRGPFDIDRMLATGTVSFAPMG